MPSSSSLASPRIALITGGDGDLASVLGPELEDNGYYVLRPGRNQLDVCHEHSVKDYFREVKQLDLLINNAGLRRDVPFVRMTEEDWEEVMEANLKGAFLCSKAATRIMVRQRHGHIVNIGSFSALSCPVGQANYAATKAGLIGLTQSLARELGPWNIRVNCLLPGWLETKFTKEVPPAIKEAVLAEHALGRFNTPLDAARTLVFLDSLFHVSGQVFQLDSRIARHL